MKEPANSGVLVIGISSRALFDLSQSHAVFESMGLQAYSEYQMAREDRFLKPGFEFGFRNFMKDGHRVVVHLSPTPGRELFK